MARLGRRFPLYGRPWPFWGGTLLALVGAAIGLGWDWNWSLQTGHVFLLLMVPRSVVHPDSWRWAGVLVALAGLFVALGAGLETRREHARTAAARGWRRATFRLFPNTFLFGLFLAYFGIRFLFDASIYGDEAPGGFAAFVYLDYAGLLQRPVTSTIGATLLGLGLLCLTSGTYEQGTGDVAPARPTMAPTAPAARVPALPRPLPRLPGSTRPPAVAHAERVHPLASPLRALDVNASTTAAEPPGRVSGRGP